MTTNNGAEPGDKDDAELVAEWYAATLRRWRTTQLALTESAERAQRAAHDVERAHEALARAMTGGANLPEQRPQAVPPR